MLQLSFCLCFQTAGADVNTYPATTLINRRPLDIGQKLPLCLPLGETHVMATHRPLATYFTFRHNFTLLNRCPVETQIKGDTLVT
jgi:hypothetical protein